MKGIRKTNMTLTGVFLALLIFSSLQNCKKTETATNSADAISLSKKMNGNNLKQTDLKLVADNFVSPIGVVAIPDDSKMLAVIDQIGKIWLIDANGNKMATPFMDISSKLVSLSPAYDERGLLGLAFHPDYKNNGRFYVYYTAPRRSTAFNNLSIISEFKRSASNPNMADLGTERPLLQLDDPQSNHNGGTVAFGPDGYLYISIGDGGGANDVAAGHVEDWYATNAGGNGQDIEANLFGNILRIDVNSGSPYGIPADNPFVNKPGLDEIYAYGLRNPFRFSFDMSGSRKLYAGDAGQVLYEEIDVIEKGGNYGWNVKEGFHCFSTATPSISLADCPDTDVYGNKLMDPVIEILNTANPAPGRKALTVIGGNVYRGNDIPGFQGKYIFGTFSQTRSPDGELLIAQPAGPGPWTYQEISLASFPDHLGQFLKGFGQDLEGEIYLTTSLRMGPDPATSTGKVYKLVLAE